MRGRNLTTGSIPALSWSLAWPVMLSIFFQTLYQLVDAFWVSRISDSAIAAVTVSQITLFVMISLTIGITVGSGVVMATSIGRRDIAEAERVLGQSFVLNLIAAVIFTTLCLTLRRQLLTLTGATGEILPLALEYFTVVAGGSVLMFVFFAVIFGFNSQGDNTTVAWLFAISTTINAGLDPLLIFGGLGIPAFGVRGAAMATIISQVLLVTAGITLLHVRDMMVQFRFRNLVFRLHSVRQVLAVGFPAALTNLLNPAGLAALNALVALAFLEAGVVGLSIGLRIEFFSFLPAIGFGVASLAMIGQNLGGGRPDRARASYRTALLFAFVLGSVVGVGALTLRGVIVGTFSNRPRGDRVHALLPGDRAAYLRRGGRAVRGGQLVSGSGQVVARLQHLRRAGSDPGGRHAAGDPRRRRQFHRGGVAGHRGGQSRRLRDRLRPVAAHLRSSTGRGSGAAGRLARQAARAWRRLPRARRARPWRGGRHPVSGSCRPRRWRHVTRA